MLRRPRASETLRRITAGKMRDLLYDVLHWRPDDVVGSTYNRAARRRLARAQRKHGRGYTKPLGKRRHRR